MSCAPTSRRSARRRVRSRPGAPVYRPSVPRPSPAPNPETQSFQAQGFQTPSQQPQDFRPLQDFQQPDFQQQEFQPRQDFQQPDFQPRQDFQQPDFQPRQDFQAPSAPQQSPPAPQQSAPMTGAYPVQAQQPPVADPTYQRGYQEGYQQAGPGVADVGDAGRAERPCGRHGPRAQRADGGPAPVLQRHEPVRRRGTARSGTRPGTCSRAGTHLVRVGPGHSGRADGAAQQSFEAPAREFSEPYPTGAVYDPTYGSPAPLAKRAAGTDGDGKDPLDPEYVRDSVEARSEWTASAVLYEEMTSLLRRGAFQEDDVKENDSYRPATVRHRGCQRRADPPHSRCLRHRGGPHCRASLGSHRPRS